MARIDVNINLNRVEGDLEIGLTLEDGVVTEARTIGTLYRGFEQIMVGRTPRDALVITPRVCGICGTAHLYSAVLALEQAWQVPVPANATRIRNLCLIAEGLQNDFRQTFLFFAPDFCNPRYNRQPWFTEALAAFEPFRGAIYLETLATTRRVVEIVAHFGGQWPHSSYMLPGGVTLSADMRRILACRAVLDEVQRWYEQRIVGASLDDWLALDSADAYFGWLEASAHADSGLGLLSRCARSLGLHRLAAGTPHMLSSGSWCDPEHWAFNAEVRLLPGGFYNGDTGQIEAVDQQLINEHVRHSWFRPYQGGRHPWQGETVPDFQPNSDRYTWAKAPRYGDKVVQTGPLAELLIAGDALITSLHAAEGGNAWLRQFARVRRVALELLHARRMLDELALNMHEPHFLDMPKSRELDGEGYGLVMAARGILGHWLRIKNGQVDKYQIVTPTAWSASPRDSAGIPGHWEQSLVGLSVQDPDNPVEIGHIIRSHDPCLVCTVHMLDTGKRVRFAP
ncbi:MAG: nickel-dependent hydrogenase large subunit [Methylomonas sp.]|jgi:hydrogenase large subunit|uniref:nickel-dependent hydrogenase large subunit n=1 Tax=Methylomonas sp. TaxID=418 RepID=UPI0025F6E541|nr:nickel-dependent hydrogenase large subunit [Methylomonas sp.]MCK9605895.1 nickel-dependent hydrogenase large subunit [Methylomonas sp.]